MKLVTIIDLPKQKTWGIITRPDDNFYTGYTGPTGRDNGVGKEMQIAKNAIISGLFRIDKMTRGRSAANFHGSFYGETYRYEMGMKAMLEIVEGLQDGKLAIATDEFNGTGYISGEWTFSKQGQDIFLRPNV